MIYLTTYVAGFILSVLVLAKPMRDELGGDSFDDFVAALLTILASIVWPVFLAAYMVSLIRKDAPR